MTNSIVSLRQIISHISCLVLVISILAMAPIEATAQRSITDGSTPLALAPGAPAGSYALSGLETINAYNGSLSFRLPLLEIGGRGSAGYVLSLPIQTHWRTVHKSNENQTIELPVSNWWSFHRHGYGAGQLEGRVGIDPNHPCIPFHGTTFLSRLTFTAPDGTEYELRDQLTGGQPQSHHCGTGAPYPSRGTVFVTADGTAATFISDTTIRDDGSAQNPTGYLSLRDGTRYRIVGGDVTWMRDRNGNLLTFAYGDKQMTVTDSLNRKVNVKYADFPAGRFYDEITYKGFAGAERTIRVNYAPLQSALRTNRPGDLGSIQTAASLFPQLTGASTPSNPYVISSVVLPGGVQQYQFLYNTYGELARAILPTAGAYEYDFGAGSANGDTSGVIWNGYGLPEIYRRVLRRRIYSDQGSTLVGLTTYSRPELDTLGYVEIDHFKADQASLLARERHYFHGIASASFDKSPLDYAPWRDGKEYKTEYYAANGSTLLKKVSTTWDQRPHYWWNGTADTAPPNNPFVAETITTLADAGLVTKTSHLHPQTGQAMIDQFNNVTDTWVYDYGKEAPGDLLNHTHTDYLTVNNGIDYSNRSSVSSPHLLSLVTRQSVYDAGDIERSRTAFEYDNYSASDNFHATLKDWPALTGAPISGLDTSFTSSHVFRGNVTATSRYLFAGSQSPQPITAYTQYDLSGNAVKSIDARSTPQNIIATTISYDDSFGSPDEEARANNIPASLGAPQLRTYAFPTVLTNALGHKTFTQFDYCLGRPVNVEDANGTVHSAAYNDSFDRPTQLIKAVNRDVTFQSRTSFAYDDAAHSVTTTADLRTFGDQVLMSQLLYDGLGRTIETRQFEGGGNFIAERRTYDALNRVEQSSNPFRPWKNELPIWNTTRFDALGRVASATTADGATSSVFYSGHELISTDQIGKKRKTVTDALGRITKVYEDPEGLNWLTRYGYDALGNLSTVIQGSQTRTFQYDALGRLTVSTQPESGTRTNSYDNNGNLLTSSDARGVVTSIQYDALNRPVSKTYQNDPAATPPVSFYYDGQQLPEGSPPNFSRGSSSGRLVAVTHTGGLGEGDYYGYDVLGRSSLKVQRTGNVNYQIAANYNVSGRSTSVTYPSGHIVSYNYDAAGRLGDRDAQALAMAGTLGDGKARTYSSGITYSNRNGLVQERFGTDIPIYNKLFYNSRGQLAEIREGTTPNNTSWNRGAIINHYSNACWGMCGGTSSSTGMPDNNGNLKRQDVYVPHNEQTSSFSTWADSYTYDNLNRLTQVHEYTGSPSLDWQQTFAYDQWGNRRIDQGLTNGLGIPKPDFTVGSNNRLTAPIGYTMTYDPSGNLTNDTYTGQGQRAYDAENRMIKAWANNQWQTYAYDAMGQRVKRNVSGTEAWQVYGLAGELLAEYAANSAASAVQKEYGYRNGQLLVVTEPVQSLRANYALAGNGAVATASSTLSASFPASGINNGDRKGLNWGNGGGWRDAEPANTFPDSIEINFPAAKTIDEVDVFTVQDNYANPAEPTEAMTFGVYGLTGFEVQYWNGNGWSTVAGGSVTDSNKVWRKLTFTPLATTKIRVRTNASIDGYSRLVEVEAWGSASAPRTNAALAGNGGVATASSQLSASFPASATNNGDRKGIGWENGGGWRDAEPRNSFPDWLQVDFNGGKTIDEVDVFTIQDNYANPSEPTESMTFTAYGQTGYEVQYWNGDSWLPVSGGSVSANNKVWRKITFPAVTTTKIRVQTTSSADGYSRLVEVEAWTASASPTEANINWLVVDQLGTPRMIFDKSGNLASTKRRDYLPFGEDLVAGTGVRSESLGYSLNDGIRQKFTSKERDSETGLDYFLARYHHSSQGRFVSPDPLLASARPANPQTWNRYAYVLNNPLRFIDPDGLADREGQVQQPPPPPAVNFTETQLLYSVPGWETDDEGFLIAAKIPVTVNLPANAAKELASVYQNTYTTAYLTAQQGAARERVGNAEQTSKTTDQTQGNEVQTGVTVGVTPSGTVSGTESSSATKSITTTRLPQLADRINTMVSISTFNDSAIDRLSQMSVIVPINGQRFNVPIGTELATNLVRMAATMGNDAASARSDNSMSTVPSLKH